MEKNLTLIFPKLLELLSVFRMLFDLYTISQHQGLKLLCLCFTQSSPFNIEV